MADNEVPDASSALETGEIATAKSNIEATSTVAAPNGNGGGMSVWLKAFIWILVIVVGALILWYLAEDFAPMIGQKKEQGKSALTASVQKEEVSTEVPESGSDSQKIVTDAEQNITLPPASLFRPIDEAATADVAPQIIQSAIDSSPPSLLVGEELKVRDAQSAAIQDARGLGMQETVKPVEQEKGPVTGAHGADLSTDDAMPYTLKSADALPHATANAPGTSVALSPEKVSASETSVAQPPTEVSKPAEVFAPMPGFSLAPGPIPAYPKGMATIQQDRKSGRAAAPRDRYYGFWQRPGFQPSRTPPRTQAFNDRAVDQRTPQARIQRRAQQNYYPRAPWGYPNPPAPYGGYGSYAPYPFKRAP